MASIYRFTGNAAELLKDIALSWQKECNTQVFGIKEDMDEFFQDLQNLTGRNDSDLLVLAEGERIIGLIGLVIFKSPLSKQRMANEHYWYVLPEHRGISSLRLLKAAEKWAKDKGCSHLLMNASCLASDLHDSVCKLYERYGMKKFETVFIKRLGGNNGVFWRWWK